MLRNFVGKMGTAYPSLAGWSKQCLTEQGPQHLNHLRREIWKLRGEFYFRKITGFGGVVKEAGVEAGQVVNKLKSPGNIAYGDIAAALVCGVQVYGAFCLGEILGRGNMVGYNVNPPADHH